MAASSSRGLEFCEDKQIWLIKKNYEDNKCNRGVKSGIMDHSRLITYVYPLLRDTLEQSLIHARLSKNIDQ